MRDDTYTPFAGKRAGAHAPMRVLHRFRKGRHVAEIVERKVTQFHAIEFLVFIDNGLTEGQMFHGSRLASYQPELQARCAQFRGGGWIEDPTEQPVVQ